MGVYLKPNNMSAGQLLEKVGMPLTPEDAEEVMWMPLHWLVAQVESLPHQPALVCNSEGELLYIKRSIATEKRSVRYYLVAVKDLEGQYE